MSAICVLAALLALEGWERGGLGRVKDLAPNAGDCRTIDPLIWCELRLSATAVTLAHARACADIALVDVLQEMAGNGVAVAEPLRKALWRGFEMDVCRYRDWDLVVVSVDSEGE